jgi:hypothetical protein
MLRTRFPVLDDELVAFLESGCATIVGLVSADGAPFATRGWGTLVLSDPARLRLLVGAGPFARAGRHVGDGARFPIAVTGASVRTLRGVQVKGVAHDLELPTDDDLARAARFCAEFFAEIEATDGTPRWLMDRLAPVDLLAVTVDVDDVYDQTPGPGAGARLC